MSQRSLIAELQLHLRQTRARRAPAAGGVGYLLRATLVVPVVAAVLVAFWQSPWSPVALERPAALVAAGDLQAASAEYERLAERAASDDVRHQAAWRAAQLDALSGDDARAGIARLDAFLAAWPDSPQAADAHALAAMLHAVELNEQAKAADRWRLAASLSPAHEHAGRWLLESGKGFAREQQLDAAARSLTQATAYADVATPAWLALARLQLTDDPSAAYEAYDAALRAAPDGSPSAALARLGKATALERLEGREAALAQLDEALAEGDVLDRSLIRRRQRLRGGL